MHYKNWLIGSISLITVNMPVTIEASEPAFPEISDQFQWSLNPDEIDILDQHDPSDEPNSSLHLLEVRFQDNNDCNKLT